MTEQDVLNPRIEKEVDKAFDYVNTLLKHYEIEAGDFALMHQDSPNQMRAIQEIEDTMTGDTPIEEVYRLLERWMRNYDGAMKRRSQVKQALNVG